MTNPKKPKRQYGTLEGWGAFLGGIAAVAAVIITLTDRRPDKSSEATSNRELQPPPISKVIEEETPVVEEREEPPAVEEEPSSSPSSGAEPPLVLENYRSSTSGKALTSGDTTFSGTVPGLPPGTSEQRVRDKLGSPSKEIEEDSFYIAVYDLVPDEVELAYVYDSDSKTVIQSEAAFSSEVSSLTKRVVVRGMLGGSSTDEIRDGLKAVGESKRVVLNFEYEGFAGFIKQNQYERTYVAVRESNS